MTTLRHRWTALRARLDPLFRKIQLRSYVMGFAAMLVLGSGYVYMTKGTNQSQAADSSVTMVQRRTITSSIKATGKVTFASEQELRFNQKGTVARVQVKEGDAVRRGQVIAELDKSTVQADIQQAALTVNASALQLQQLRSQKDQTLTDAQNTAREAERQLQQTQDDLAVARQKAPTDIEAAERGVQEKQAAFAQAQLDLEKQKATEVQSLASTAQDTLVTAEQLLDSFYTVLTNDASARPTSGDYTLEIYHLLSNDISLQSRVRNDYLEALNGTRKMREAYGTSLATQRDPSIVMQALSDAQVVARATYALGEDTYAMLQGASTGTTGFTVTDLNALRSTVSGNRTKASALVGDIEAARTNLSAVSSQEGMVSASSPQVPSVTLKAKQDALTNAEHALRQARDNLALLQTQTPATLRQQQDTLQKVQEDLQSKKAAAGNTATTTDINIKLKQNDVAQKATALAKARKALQDYQLTAPFDGVVTRMDYKVGDNLLDTGDTAYAVLQNHDSVVVTIPLDQVDVVRAQKGMAATITFDAVPDKQFEGAIDAIESTPIEQSGVVSYNVSIKLPTPEGLTILSGMTATVAIQTAKKESVLAVPNLALQQANGRATVKTADGRPVPVETGVTDGQYTEITLGLQEGDQILSLNISIQTQSSGNNAGQFFRMGGAGGLGGGNIRTFQR